MITPLHFSLGNRARSYLKKQTNKQIKEKRKKIKENGKKKKKKETISWAWWCAPVVPATREAEVGGSLEPGRWRLQ